MYRVAPWRHDMRMYRRSITTTFCLEKPDRRLGDPKSGREGGCFDQMAPVPRQGACSENYFSENTPTSVNRRGGNHKIYLLVI